MSVVDWVCKKISLESASERLSAIAISRQQVLPSKFDACANVTTCCSTGVDFAVPIAFKIAKKEQGKCCILLFTCATSRALHLELTKTQTAEEF